jgi:hypothetical protein
MNDVTRTVYLPAIEKTVTLRQYVAAVKLAKANPDQEFKHGLTCWWPCSGREIVAQFWRGVEDRINQAVPYMRRGIEEAM